MEQILEFLLYHIEMVVFFTVLAEQIGLPLPAIPVLLAAGAVAGDGQASLTRDFLAYVVLPGVPNRNMSLSMPHLAHLVIPFSGEIRIAA